VTLPYWVQWSLVLSMPDNVSWDTGRASRAAVKSEVVRYWSFV